MQDFKFPLDFTFNIGTLSNDFTAVDTHQKTVAYVKQKLFKFKEDVSVFENESKTKVLYKIKADRWIDFSACYSFSDPQGKELGCMNPFSSNSDSCLRNSSCYRSDKRYNPRFCGRAPSTRSIWKSWDLRGGSPLGKSSGNTSENDCKHWKTVSGTFDLCWERWQSENCLVFFVLVESPVT